MSSLWHGEPAAGRTYARAGSVGGGGALLAFLAVLLDGHWSLLRRAAITTDFYDLQAHSLLDGRWDVPRRSLFAEGFLVHGKVYEYFGPVPAILRMPIALFTHSLDGRLGGVSMLLAMTVGLASIVLLLWRLRVVGRGEAPVTRGESIAVAVFTFTAGAGSVLIFLASRTYVFHEAEIWGAVLTIAAFERVIAVTQVPNRRNVVLASLVSSLALLTRGSVGLGPVLALACLAAAALWPATRRFFGVGGDPTRRWLVLSLLAAAAVPLLLYAYVNHAKFGSPFSVPFEKQFLAKISPNHKEALAANHGTMFGLAFIPTTMWSYLRPDGIRLSSLLPWVEFGPAPRVFGGAKFAFRLPTVSLTSSMPYLTVLALVSCVGIARPRRNRALAVLRAPLLGAAAASVTTFAFAYIADRYLADLVPILIVLAVAGLHLVLRWSPSARVPVRRVAWTALGVLAVASIWFNIGIAVVHSRVVEAAATRADITHFVDLQYRVHGVFPGGKPPRVLRLRTLPRTAAPGTVVILGDCDALYYRQAGRWRVLERGPGGGSFSFQVRFPRAPTTALQPVVIVGTDRPTSVTAEVLPGNRARFAVDGVYRSRTIDITPGRTYRVDVVLDPNVGQASIAVDGRSLLSMPVPNQYFPSRLPALHDVTVGRNEANPRIAAQFDGELHEVPASMSVCRRLERQL